MRPRSAITGVFFVNGAIAGSWVAQIPWVQERFGLSKTAMGFVLLGLSVGVVVALPVAGQLIVRHGSVQMIRSGALAAVAVLSVVLSMPNALLLTLGLFALGACNATMDVAMNAHGVTVERNRQRPIMSSLHAGWAFGGMAGAALAAAGVAAALDPRVIASVSAGLFLLLVLFFIRHLGVGSAAEGEAAPAFTLPSRAVLLLAVLVLLFMVCEGAMADWGGLLLRESTGASASTAALAFSCFAGGMTLGRLVGDPVNQRIGPVSLLRWGAALTVLALAVMLLTDVPAVALLGLFIVGVGVANGVPLMFSAAGRLPDTAPGPGIAAIASMGALGFVAGPPLIGFLADATSLPWALSTMVLGAIVVFALARRAAGVSGSPSSRSHPVSEGTVRP